MCGGGRMRYDQLPNGQALIHIARNLGAEVVGVNTPTLLAPRDLVKPGEPVMTVVWSKTYQTRVLLPMIWGWQTSWSQNNIINARDDRLLTLNSWREPMENGQRCIVLFSSFIEKGQDFSLGNNQMIALAGIYQANHVVIVTTEPNDDVRPIHHRMPAVMDVGTISRWTQPEYSPLRAQHLLEPYQGKLLRRVA